MNTVNGQPACRQAGRSTVNVSNIKIKICGNTNLEDSLLAAGLGADYIGFIFYPKSPRYIKQEQAAEIIKQLPKSCQPVGVFVNQSIDEVRQSIEQCGLQFIQLHGDESPEFAAGVPAKVIKALRIKNVGRVSPACRQAGETRRVNSGVLGEPALQNVNRFQSTNIFAYLFDTYVEGLYGGTGQRFDLSSIKDKHFNRPFFISGGLTPQNVVGILELVHPYGVDVCSGVEATPGKKDPHKLEEFIEIATH